MLNASVDMLYHLGHVNHAKAIDNAIYKTLTVDKIFTKGEFDIFSFFRSAFNLIFILQIWAELIQVPMSYKIY